MASGPENTPENHFEQQMRNNCQILENASLTNQPAAIDIAHVDVRRGDLHILQDISAAVPQGSSTVLVGPNGAGKAPCCTASSTTTCRRSVMQGKAAGDPPGLCAAKSADGQRPAPDRGRILSWGHQRRPLWLGIKGQCFPARPCGSSARACGTPHPPSHERPFRRRTASRLAGRSPGP